MVSWTILTQEHYQISNWSGGKTRQLYLFPPTGNYGIRDFDYRISTATVDLTSSTFTALPTYQRILMTLDQPIRLVHVQTQKEVQLQPFTPYSFEGRDKITSRGTCTDFNLIYSDHYQAKMKTISQTDRELCQREKRQFIYALCDLELDLAGKNIQLLKEQLLVMEKQSQEAEIAIRFSTEPLECSPVAIWAGLNKKEN